MNTIGIDIVLLNINNPDLATSAMDTNKYSTHRYISAQSMSGFLELQPNQYTYLETMHSILTQSLRLNLQLA